MSTLRQALYGIALLGALTLLLWGNYQRSQAEQGRTALADQKAQQLQERSTRQAVTIVRLGAEFHAQRLAQQSLQQTVTDLRQAHATDNLKKKELQREDHDYRSWAAQPLAPVARRLHERPALSGAASYRQWLSHRHALQPQAGGAAE